jgi:hypothetical protein
MHYNLFFETEAKELPHSLFKKKRVVQFIYGKLDENRNNHGTPQRQETTQHNRPHDHKHSQQKEHLHRTDEDTHSKK